jgi:hypothetical protein
MDVSDPGVLIVFLVALVLGVGLGRLSGESERRALAARVEDHEETWRIWASRR